MPGQQFLIGPRRPIPASVQAERSQACTYVRMHKLVSCTVEARARHGNDGLPAVPRLE